MLYYLLHSIVRLMFVGKEEDRACLYFYFLDRYSWAHEKIVLASIFCFRIDRRRHTRISCLHLFSDWFDLSSMTFLLDCSL